MTNGKPLIGLTCSYEIAEGQERVFLNHDYLEAVRRWGGLPVILPSDGSEDELA